MRRFTLMGMFVGIGILAAGAPFGTLRSSTLLGVCLRPTGLNLIFLGLLSATLLIGSGRYQSLVRRPILQFFGWISYGLYLIHMMVFDFVDFLINRYIPAMQTAIAGRFDLMVLRFLLGLGLAVTISVLSRIYFEEYFLRLKDRWVSSPKNPNPIPATATSRSA